MGLLKCFRGGILVGALDKGDGEPFYGFTYDEAYLKAHTTVIRNVDVLRGGMTCGIVCIDEEGNVLGHVSQTMQAWRERNCQWVEYGMADC